MKELMVVKYGSSSVANQLGMDFERLDTYAHNLCQVSEQFDLIVVSSGAVAVGKAMWHKTDKRDLALSDRSAAMMGSAKVVTAWQEALEVHGLIGGQLLVTDKEIEDYHEGPRLLGALRENIAHGIITIANENDALSVTELKKLAYGEDNDGLAKHLAITVGASVLCLMTDKKGLLDDRRLVRTIGADEVERNHAHNYVDIAASGKKGGGRTKLKALIEASDAGIDGYWAGASSSFDAVLGGKTGTHFVAGN